MRKIVLVGLLSASCLSFSQNAFVRDNLELVNGGYVSTNVAKTNLQYSDIDGSPYINKNFRVTSIAKNYKEVNARYDSFRDLIEYKSNDELRVIPKEAQFNRIEFTSPDEIMVLANLDGKSSGYYYLLEEGNVSLFKELRTKFSDFKKASSSYDTDKSASFKMGDPVFYMQIGDKVIVQPKNDKQIIEFLPERKAQINSFVKEKNIKFNKEEDLKKLAKFLNE